MKPVVLITGASGNLGKAVVKRFYDENWEVIAVLSERSKAEVLNDFKGIQIFKTDAANEQKAADCLSKIIKTNPVIDAAVLTVGGYESGTIGQTSVKQIDKLIRLNFYSAWNFAQPVFKLMTQNNKGRLVMIGSQVAVKEEGGLFAIAYTLSKSVVIKLAELLNGSGNKHQVRCHTVNPSTIDTPQNRTAVPDADFTKWQKPKALAEEIFNFVNS